MPRRSTMGPVPLRPSPSPLGRSPRAAQRAIIPPVRIAAIGGVLAAGLMLACQEPEPEPTPPSSTSDAAPPLAAPAPLEAPDPTQDERTEPRPASTTRPSILDLAFVGDIVLGEYVFDDHRSLAGPASDHDPFSRVADSLRADLLIGNLESPVMREVPEHSPLRFGHRFGGSAAAVDALAAAGFDVMSVANNHANDLGRPGLEQTPAILGAAGLLAAGAARHEGSVFRVETLEHAGWRIGFLSAATWLNNAPAPGDPAIPLARTGALTDALVPKIRAARAEHDLLVVLLHWGRERREEPGFVQVNAAHDLVDAGADLVIGHHPHVLQGIERYGDGLIAYSLGNFLFPARVHEFRDTGILHVRWNVETRCPAGATFEALRLDRALGHGPRPTTARERRTILDRIQRLSRSLRTHWHEQDETMVLAGCEPTPPPPKEQ